LGQCRLAADRRATGSISVAAGNGFNGGGMALTAVATASTAVATALTAVATALNGGGNGFNGGGNGFNGGGNGFNGGGAGEFTYETANSVTVSQEPHSVGERFPAHDNADLDAADFRPDRRV